VGSNSKPEEHKSKLHFGVKAQNNPKVESCSQYQSYSSNNENNKFEIYKPSHND
jgi:hypothetical protein